MLYEVITLADMFPYIFASLAISVGLATYLNSRFVVRFGARTIAFYAAAAYTVISLVYVVVFFKGNNPSIEVLIGFFAISYNFV